MRTTREPDNDAALMRAFASRDRNAADTLYARFASRIYGLGIVMLGSDAAAQDLVQDTFVKLWRNADRYDTTRGKLETWVLLVARSTRHRLAAAAGAGGAIARGHRTAS